MIGKIMKNNSFRATTRYVLEKEEARLLDGGTIVEGTTDEISREFRMSRDLNPEIERPVYHLVQSYSYSDRIKQNLDDDKSSELALRHFAGMVVLGQEPALLKQEGRAIYRERVEAFLEEGLFEYQFFVAKHEDTEHTHTHLVASRINLLDGHCIPTYKDHYRSQVVCRELEKDFGLEQIPSTGEVERRSLSRRQVEKEKQTGVAPVMTKLQDVITEVASEHQGFDFEEFVQTLADQGIEVRWSERQTQKGTQIGISYAMDGVAIAGSKLGRGFTYAGLQERFILNFVEQRLDEKKLNSLKTQDKAYSITRDPVSQVITLTRANGEVMLKGKRTETGWNTLLSNVQPNDVQAFNRYQKAREEKEKQQTKQKQKQIARSRGSGGLEL